MARLETLPIELLRLIADFVVANAIPNNIETKGPFRWAYCDLAALALTNQEFNRIFEPLLYQWDEQQDECHSISWAVQSDEIGTLERALASGFDFNRTLHTLSARRDLPGYNDVIVGISLGTYADHILKWLLEHGTKPEPFEPRTLETLPHPASYERESPLFQSFGFCHNQEVALILLQCGARPFFIQPNVTSYKHALGEAARAGFERVVEQLLQDGTFQWAFLDGNGCTALDHAVEATFPNTAVIEVLLRHGASDFRRKESGLGNAMSPRDLYNGLLLQAFQGGHVDNVVALLRNINEHDPDFYSQKSLWS
ncbi:hypothetical protein KJ359_004228 [Pestalotiopsis sp. 9143b]|nr:hypothetical protein KJ359_004228 [Pestalotiopsis sp. 9143b]